MKPDSDAAGIGTLANLRFAYEFSYKNSHKNKSVSEVWKARPAERQGIAPKRRK